MTFTEQEELDRQNWLAVASRVVAGEFDEKVVSKVRKVAKRIPPQGSLATALVSGLKWYKKEPVCRDALDHIRNPE